MAIAATPIPVVVQATAESVANPTTLARHINASNTAVSLLQARLLSLLSPNLPASVIKAQTGSDTLTGGTTYYLQHGLGRPYVGYLVTRSTAAGTLVEQSLKLGQNKSQFIALQPSATGIYDLMVF